MTKRPGAEQKWYGGPYLFDPEDGETVILPDGEGPGHWAGAPSVLFDRDTAKFYLSYRVRKPRPVRGGECYIAESENGQAFETIWASTKEAFGSTSVERFCLARALDGKWLLYPSYVDPADSRWRIDVIEADEPSRFDVSARRPLLNADDIGAQGVKDPWVMVVDGAYYMLVSYAVTTDVSSVDRDRRHATADIYNTGLTLSSTGLAISGDGRDYRWQGDVFTPRAGQTDENGAPVWDAYAARLGCLVPGQVGWIGYYDGAASVEGNYEERTGLVVTPDLREFWRLIAGAPSLVSPHGSGSLRYIDAVVFDDEIWFYYEYCRPDGSHELRLNRVPRSQ